MAEAKPNVIVIAGPNGAGKSTIAPSVLRGTLKVSEFVNADVIARGLSAFDPNRAAMAAGRVMLTRLDELAAARVDFAFETTLASRTFAPWIKTLVETGYVFRLIYIWLPMADLSVKRVASRVTTGGHNVPEDVIRRRYGRGLSNFFELYRPLAATWRCYDNTMLDGPRLIAWGRGDQYEQIRDRETWKAIVAAAQELRPET